MPKSIYIDTPSLSTPPQLTLDKRRHICTSSHWLNQSPKPVMQNCGLENQECPSWFGRSMFLGGAVITKRLPAPHCAPKIPTPPPRIGQLIPATQLSAKPTKNNIRRMKNRHHLGDSPFLKKIDLRDMKFHKQYLFTQRNNSSVKSLQSIR